jgi:hypothetical protein
VGLAVLLLVANLAWQVTVSEIANNELHDEMSDLAGQLGARIGAAAPRSDDQMRDAIIRSAGEHGISLAPSQVDVRRSADAQVEVTYLGAHYEVQVGILGCSFALHFHPSITKTQRWSGQ